MVFTQALKILVLMGLGIEMRLKSSVNTINIKGEDVRALAGLSY